MLFLSTSLAIALSVKDLGIMLSLVGATGSTIVSYILPGLCYYKMFSEDGPEWKRRMAFGQFVAGLFIIPICLTFIFF